MENFGLRILPAGQLETNCYLVFDRKAGEGLIIDPADEADYIERVIADEKFQPLKILATHGHFDHILAATELQLAYQLPFFVHPKDEFLVKNLSRSAEYFLKTNWTPPPPKIDGYLKKEEKIPFGQYQLEVWETPGHTPGSSCFYLKEKRVLFCGDTLFKEGVGRTDFSYSLPKELERSLKKIFSLPPTTTFYPGHGEKFQNRPGHLLD